MAIMNASMFVPTTSAISEEYIPDTTLNECSEEGYGVFLFLSLIFIAISVPVGIIGNVLVSISVYDNRSLRNANNALLVNLAAADLMTCTLSAPIAWTVILMRFVGHGASQIPPMICSLQVHFNIMSYTVQLMTLALISIERHAAITHPFEKKKKRRRVTMGILLGWIFGFLFGILSIFCLSDIPIFIICSCDNMSGVDGSNLSAHLYILTPLGIVCFLVIVCYYIRIYLVVRKHVKDHGRSFTALSLTEDVTRTSFVHQMFSIGRRRFKVNQVAPNDTIPELGTDVAVAREDMTPSAPKPIDLTEVHGSSDDEHGAVPRSASEVSSFFSRPDLHSILSSSSSVNQRGFILRNLNDIANVQDNTLIGKCVFPTSTKENGRNPCVFHSEPDMRDFILTDSASERPSSALAIQTPEQFSESVFSISQNVEYRAVTSNNRLGVPSRVGHGPRSTSYLNIPGLVPIPGRDDSSESIPGKDDNVATESQLDEVAETANVVGSVCVFNPKNRERGRRNVEAGTAKRTAYIIILFSLCWIPLFIVTLVNASPHTTAPLNIMVFFSCTVLFSSAANPVVYTVVNRSFRTEFKKLLHKPIKWMGHS